VGQDLNIVTLCSILYILDNSHKILRANTYANRTTISTLKTGSPVLR